jgi:hypothetical protein
MNEDEEPENNQEVQYPIRRRDELGLYVFILINNQYERCRIIHVGNRQEVVINNNNYPIQTREDGREFILLDNVETPILNAIPRQNAGKKSKRKSKRKKSRRNRF